MRFDTGSLLMLALASLVAGDSPCPPGFVPNQKSCYWFSSITANFAEARSFCQYLESHLARVTSKDEDQFIRGHASIHGRGYQYWLGATDLNTEGTWLWEGEQPMVYSNWGHSQPDNGGGVEHCLDIKRRFQNYMWNDENCMASKVNFICEKEL